MLPGRVLHAARRIPQGKHNATDHIEAERLRPKNSARRKGSHMRDMPSSRSGSKQATCITAALTALVPDETIDRTQPRSLEGASSSFPSSPPSTEISGLLVRPCGMTVTCLLARTTRETRKKKQDNDSRGPRCTGRAGWGVRAGPAPALGPIAKNDARTIDPARVPQGERRERERHKGRLMRPMMTPRSVMRQGPHAGKPQTRRPLRHLSLVAP